MKERPASHLAKLKRRMESLGGEIVPAIQKAESDAAPRVRKLLDFAELAVEFAPEVAGLVGNWISRRDKAPTSGARSIEVQRGFVSRHPMFTGGLAIGAVLVAYSVWGSKLVRFVRTNLRHAA